MNCKVYIIKNSPKKYMPLERDNTLKIYKDIESLANSIKLLLKLLLKLSINSEISKKSSW